MSDSTGTRSNTLPLKEKVKIIATVTLGLAGLTSCIFLAAHYGVKSAFKNEVFQIRIFKDDLEIPGPND